MADFDKFTILVHRVFTQTEAGQELYRELRDQNAFRPICKQTEHQTIVEAAKREGIMELINRVKAVEDSIK